METFFFSLKKIIKQPSFCNGNFLLHWAWIYFFFFFFQMCFRLLLWSRNKLPIRLLKFAKGSKLLFQRRQKKKNVFRKFIPSSVSSDTAQSQPLPNRFPPKCLLSVSFFSFPFFFLLFIFVVLWQDYLSSVKKDLTSPKQQQLTISSLWSVFSSWDLRKFILPFLRGGCFYSQLCLWYDS